MFERESTLNEDIPVEEKFPPISEINDLSVKNLWEAAEILSVIINDVSGRNPNDSTKGREPPHCLQEQAILIERISSDVARMAMNIKGMITA